MAVKNPGEPFTRIDVNEAKEKIDSGAVQLIDVRTPGEFNGGHAPGAINIPHMSSRLSMANLAISDCSCA